MYYEEKVIEGTLMWRGTPNGAWLFFTIPQLSERYLELKLECAKLRQANAVLEDRLDTAHLVIETQKVLAGIE